MVKDDIGENVSINESKNNINVENLIYNENKFINKKCVLCGKTYDYKYTMFGRECLSNLYLQLHVSKIRGLYNKESHLWNIIALRNFKLFISEQKKKALLENYIALDYVKKMKLPSLNRVQTSLKNNIKSITIRNELTDSMYPMYSLNDFYNVYRDYKKFEVALAKAKNAVNAGGIFNKYDESILTGLSFVFDVKKIVSPLQYLAYYGMQYLFWKTVVVGGLMTKMKLSAYLLNISLDNSGGYNENNRLIIKNEYIRNLLLNNSEFKEKINNELINENINIENKEYEFQNGDLFFSLHKAKISIISTKNIENKWNLKIEIKDTYDFTDIKELQEYYNSTESVPKSIFSSTLNNYAAVSSS